MHNFYQTEKIDNLYVGSSHVFTGINPFLLDELTGEENFNLSTSSQQFITSYYLIKEALRTHQIKHVFLDIYFGVATNEYGNYSNGTAMKFMWPDTDNMEFSLNKIQAILDANTKENWGNAILPFIRFRQYAFDANYITENKTIKNSTEFKNYQYYEETEDFSINYQEKGFHDSDRVLSNMLYFPTVTPAQMELAEDSEEYLRKIITLCQQNNVQITLISVPVYELSMLSLTSSYDTFRTQITDIAHEYGIDFYDFTLVREEYLPLQDPNLHFDFTHLNTQGSIRFSRFFYDLVFEKKYDPDEVFFHSYEEKRSNLPEKTWGILSDADGCHIVATPQTGLLHKVLITPENGKQYVLQEFSKNLDFTLEPETHGTVTIETKYSNGTIYALDVQY